MEKHGAPEALRRKGFRMPKKDDGARWTGRYGTKISFNFKKDFQGNTANELYKGIYTSFPHWSEVDFIIIKQVNATLPDFAS